MLLDLFIIINQDSLLIQEVQINRYSLKTHNLYSWYVCNIHFFTVLSGSCGTETHVLSGSFPENTSTIGVDRKHFWFFLLTRIFTQFLFLAHSLPFNAEWKGVWGRDCATLFLCIISTFLWVMLVPFQYSFREWLVFSYVLSKEILHLIDPILKSPIKSPYSSVTKMKFTYLLWYRHARSPTYRYLWSISGNSDTVSESFWARKRESYLMKM